MKKISKDTILVISNEDITNGIIEYNKTIGEKYSIIESSALSSISDLPRVANNISIVLLDLESEILHYNAIAFLSIFNHIEFVEKPLLVIMTSTRQNQTAEAAILFQADLIIAKNSPTEMIESIRMLQSLLERRHPGIPKILTEEEKKKNFAKKIIRELNAIGMNPKCVGYSYLIDIIQLMKEDPGPGITKKLAKKNGKSASSIERAIQNAINRTWNNNPSSVLQEHYTAPVTKKAPTVTEFIWFYVNKIEYQ